MSAHNYTNNLDLNYKQFSLAPIQAEILRLRHIKTVGDVREMLDDHGVDSMIAELQSWCGIGMRTIGKLLSTVMDVNKQ